MGDRILTDEEWRDALSAADGVLQNFAHEPKTQARTRADLRPDLMAFSQRRQDRSAPKPKKHSPPKERAEQAMSLLLMVLDQGRKNGQSARLAGKTLGIIGFDTAAQEMARRAHFGFELKILVFDPKPVDPKKLAAVNAKQLSGLDQILPLCDFVSIHESIGEMKRHAINSKHLDLMKPSAVLIQASNGDPLDMHSLAHSLWFETIAGAGMMGCSQEILNSPLFDGVDNLVMMPHGEQPAAKAAVLDEFEDLESIIPTHDRVA